jgi:deoxyribonuclease-4
MNNNKYIGFTLNLEKNILDTLENSKKINSNFVQIFLSPPQQFNPKRRSKQELINYKLKAEQLNIKTVIHSSYLLNFCNPPDSKIYKNAVNLLVQDMNDSVIIGAIGVIIHMGKKLKYDYDTALNNYISGIKLVLEKSDQQSVLILETGAGVGSEICTSIQDLSMLYNRFTDKEKSRIKFCIDTCHVFSSGYNISIPNYASLFFDLLDFYLDKKNIVCIHLNNSKCPCNSKKDRHADLGDTKGYISDDGLMIFSRLCLNNNIPIVLETPEDIYTKEGQIDRVIKWSNYK